MNKSQYEVPEELIGLVENGYLAFRALDNICKAVSRKDIRQKYNIQ